MHRGLAITNKGIEDITSIEVKELAKATDTEEKETAVIFNVKDLADLCLLCYKAQSVHRVILLLGTAEVTEELESSADAVGKMISQTDFSEYLDEKTSFKVEARREGEHGYHSVDIATEAAQAIVREIKARHSFSPKISMDSPDIVFYLYICGRRCYLGIDFSGFDLSKRDYRIFSHPEAVKATIAYALVRLSGYKNGQKMLDPFCGSGIIPIEAALFASGTPVNFYKKDKFAFTKFRFLKLPEDFFSRIDSKIGEPKEIISGSDVQLRFMASAQKNAKLAGISKFAKISRIDIEWLDTKFEEKSIDYIVTDPPMDSKVRNTKDIEKIYNEFFYQAEFILKKKGNITALSRSPELMKAAAEKQKFNIAFYRDIYSGKQKLTVLCFKR